jgi:hypothetical protein
MNKDTGITEEARRNPEAPESQEPVQVDGLNQVLEMLKIADPAFRESLLTRLANRDRELARTLRRDLADLGL